MQTLAVRDRLKRLMADLFRCEEAEIADSTGPGDLPGWDSLGHVSLMTELQREFGVHVPIEDALDVESFEGLVLVVERLLGERV
ncbi:MAG: acyl carrier protein [Planctomycetaceae bacterium]